MKVIVAGSRGISDPNAVADAIEQSGWDITEIVSGGAAGVDLLGEAFARFAKIEIKQFIPDWRKYGKRAGPLRNKDMAKYADGLIAIWDGQSRGTKNMIDEMQALKKPVIVRVV
jgi:hypothetical protein